MYKDYEKIKVFKFFLTLNSHYTKVVVTKPIAPYKKVNNRKLFWITTDACGLVKKKEKKGGEKKKRRKFHNAHTNTA